MPPGDGVKSYLLSWLRKTHAGANPGEFVAERGGSWLVWEAGPWRPPSSARRETLLTGPQTRLLASGESLAIQLAARDGSPQVTLGRAANNDVAIDDATLSRVHLVLERGAGGWTVRDGGSRNGTKVNGSAVGASPVRVGAGARIEAGAVRLTFYDAGGLYARLRSGE